jgi:hypothetical protein
MTATTFLPEDDYLMLGRHITGLSSLSSDETMFGRLIRPEIVLGKGVSVTINDKFFAEGIYRSELDRP